MTSRIENQAIEAGLLVPTGAGRDTTRWTDGDHEAALERFVCIVRQQKTVANIRADQQNLLCRYDLNIVTCGNCGEPFIITSANTSHDSHTCPFCDMTADPCDFPDLFH